MLVFVYGGVCVWGGVCERSHNSVLVGHLFNSLLFFRWATGAAAVLHFGIFVGAHASTDVCLSRFFVSFRFYAMQRVFIVFVMTL